LFTYQNHQNTSKDTSTPQHPKITDFVVDQKHL